MARIGYSVILKYGGSNSTRKEILNASNVECAASSSETVASTHMGAIFGGASQFLGALPQTLAHFYKSI